MQPSLFTNLLSSITQDLFGGGAAPSGVAIDQSRGNLYVLDGANNRILMFDYGEYPSVNGPNAKNVLGQPDLNTTSSTELLQASGIFYHEPTGTIWVANTGHNQVLAYKAFRLNDTFYNELFPSNALLSTERLEFSGEASTGPPSVTLFSIGWVYLLHTACKL